jgi:thiamine transport system substrate-binding protein
MPAEEMVMRRSRSFVTSFVGLCATSAALFALAGCSQSVRDQAAGPGGVETVTLLTHDSFVVDKSLLAAFKKQTGITVQVQTVGDAGQLVSSAVLAAGAPAGDVLYGVDNSLAAKAVQAKVFAPYNSPNLAHLVPALQHDTFGGVLTPVDYGDVCVVADNAWFTKHHVAQPTSLADLAKPAYKNLLVAEDPALSSPGTAFLYATIARYGDGWQNYWSQLQHNGVKIASSWTQAYDGDFSAGGGKGTRPLVVSYGTDAAADIIFASDPKPTKPGVSVMHDGCYRQVEYAGVLAGSTKQPAAREVVDWLTNVPFQKGIPMNMFVYPARAGVTLPIEFQKWAPQAANPLQLAPAEVAAHQTQWLTAWGSVMGR